MKDAKLPCVAMMMWMALPGFGAAVETVSESFVGSAVSIPGVQGGSAERIGFFSLRAARPAIYGGRVSAVGATSITDDRANWTSAQFAGRGPIYAEFDNGVEADIQQVSFGSRRLTFSGPLPPSVTVNVRYHIRQHHTVAEVFGPTNQAGLLAGRNIGEADTIRHFIPETQQTRIYFYCNLTGLTGWLLDNYSAASNTVIYPEQGLMVGRRSTADLTFSSSGPLKSVASTIPVFPGYNMLGLYHRATPVRLDQLNLTASGFVAGQNPNVGDNLLMLNPDGTTALYFYSTIPTLPGWLNYAYQPAGNVTISPGDVFMLYRRAPSQAFDWTLPAQ